MFEEYKEELYKEISNDQPISQGDILFNFPIMRPDDSFIESMEDIKGDTLREKAISVEILEADIIILSQSCDLVSTPSGNRKPVDPVVCAAIFDISNYSKNLVMEANSGRRPAYYLLNRDSLMDKSHIIDFSNIFTIPYSMLSKFANTSANRIRPISPILEKISQHFGNYFSRIGTEYERDSVDLKEEYEKLKEAKKSISQEP